MEVVATRNKIRRIAGALACNDERLRPSRHIRQGSDEGRDNRVAIIFNERISTIGKRPRCRRDDGEERNRHRNRAEDMT